MWTLPKAEKVALAALSTETKSAISQTTPRISGPDPERLATAASSAAFFYIGEHDFAAHFGKSSAYRQADAARATSHKGDLTNELPHHFLAYRPLNCKRNGLDYTVA
jgi:hypothetical protein